MSWDEDYKINFYSWLRAWKDEHKKAEKQIIAEIQWACRYKVTKIPFSNAPPPIIPINTNSITAGIMRTRNEIYEEWIRGKYRIQKDIVYDINKVTIWIVPYPEESTSKIILVNEELIQKTADKLRQTLNSVAIEFLDIKNLSPTEEDWENSKRALDGAEDNEKRIVEVPSYAASLEMALCQMVTIYILENDWENKDFPNNWLISNLESESKRPIQNSNN